MVFDFELAKIRLSARQRVNYCKKIKPFRCKAIKVKYYLVLTGFFLRADKKNLL